MVQVYNFAQWVLALSEATIRPAVVVPGAFIGEPWGGGGRRVSAGCLRAPAQRGPGVRAWSQGCGHGYPCYQNKQPDQVHFVTHKWNTRQSAMGSICRLYEKCTGGLLCRMGEPLRPSAVEEFDQKSLLFFLCLMGCAWADIEIRKGGSSWASINSSGELRVGGSTVGQVRKDG